MADNTIGMATPDKLQWLSDNWIEELEFRRGASGHWAIVDKTKSVESSWDYRVGSPPALVGVIQPGGIKAVAATAAVQRAVIIGTVLDEALIQNRIRHLTSNYNAVAQEVIKIAREQAIIQIGLSYDDFA